MESESCTTTGRLVLVSTPIGNLGDLSPRAVSELEGSEAWIVEDTRVSGKLQAHLGVKRPMRILNDHSSDAALDRLLGELARGARYALLTDGGTPVVSDPGAALADRCLEAGIEVDVIPGPSAVTAALAISGFYGQRFAFLGFLARKPGAIISELSPFAESSLTLVLFESPMRLAKLLEVAHRALGNRRYAVCRELTKLHQQVYRARLPHVPSTDEVVQKGEVTVVIEGKRRGDAA